ncbi:MAG TPA: sensor histidine kinase [Acidobacteriaceae bacterium]|jgi:signal transduction histidine kinase|nr:sensor histidine kinase [Acidobacteriaceae bacterium]
MQQTDRWTASHAEIDAAAHAPQTSRNANPLSGSQRWLSDQTVGQAGVPAARQPAVAGQSILGNSSAHSLASLIHDARNMVSAMDLYCDLLAEPGVLAPPFLHYAGELRLVSGAGRRLLETLAVAESVSGMQTESSRTAAVEARMSYRTGPAVELLPSRTAPEKRRGVQSDPSSWFLGGASRPLAKALDNRLFPGGQPIGNLAGELRANQNLLAALVGPRITLDFSIGGGERPIAMTGDDLTRVLVNLARNAADAMPSGGHLQVRLEEGAEYLSLLFIDDGPGIPEEALESIFSPGFSSHLLAPHVPAESTADSALPSLVDSAAWPVQHRGLGLSIVRSIVSAAGGGIWAANRNSLPLPESSPSAARSGDLSPQQSGGFQGAVFVIEFPLLDSRNST